MLNTAYNIGVQKALLDAGVQKTSSIRSRLLEAAPGAVLGAAGGAALDEDQRWRGALVGAGLGGLGSSIASGLTARRVAPELEELQSTVRYQADAAEAARGSADARRALQVSKHEEELVALEKRERGHSRTLDFIQSEATDFDPKRFPASVRGEDPYTLNQVGDYLIELRKRAYGEGRRDVAAIAQAGGTDKFPEHLKKFLAEAAEGV